MRPTSPFFSPDNFAHAGQDVFNGLVDANVIGVQPALAPALRSLQLVASAAQPPSEAFSARAR